MRTLVRVAAAIGALLILAVAGVAFYLDRIAAGAIERGASYALGVETRVGSVRLGLLHGDFGLSGLAVANPEGFENPHFLKLAKAEVRVPLRALAGDPAVIPVLVLEGIEISLERKAGNTNYGIILRNLAKLESAGTSSSTPGASSKGFVVRELLIRDVTARARLLPVGGKLSEFSVNVPEIRLANVGAGTRDGIPMAQLVDLLTKALLKAVVEKSGGLPGGLGAELEAGLSRLEGVKIDLPGALGETEKALGSRLSGAAQKGGELLRKGVGSLLHRGPPREDPR